MDDFLSDVVMHELEEKPPSPSTSSPVMPAPPTMMNESAEFMPLLVVANIDTRCTNQTLREFLRDQCDSCMRKVRIVHRNKKSQGWAFVETDAKNEQQLHWELRKIDDQDFSGKKLLCRFPVEKERKLFIWAYSDTKDQPPKNKFVIQEPPPIFNEEPDLLGILQPADVTPLVIYAIDFEAALVVGNNLAIPNEVGIVRFDLGGKESTSFHRLIRPTGIPEDGIATAWYTTTKIHGIPFVTSSPDFELLDGNYPQIFQDMCNFVGVDYVTENDYIEMTLHEKLICQERTRKCILVAKGPRTEVTCLQWLATQAGAHNSFPRVVDITELFQAFAARLGQILSPEVLNRLVNAGFQLYDDTVVSREKCGFHGRKGKKMTFHCALEDAFVVSQCAIDVLHEDFPDLVVAEKLEKWRKIHHHREVEVLGAFEPPPALTPEEQEQLRLEWCSTQSDASFFFQGPPPTAEPVLARRAHYDNTS